MGERSFQISTRIEDKSSIEWEESKKRRIKNQISQRKGKGWKRSSLNLSHEG